MEVKELLKKMDLGNSVAEFDEALEEYFVETSIFRDFVANRADIIAGDKGTGKTAMYKYLKKTYATMPELTDVEIVSAFNPSGDSIFQRMGREATLPEGQYISIWKAYILSLVGNWLLGIYEDHFTDKMIALDDILKKMDLRISDDAPSTIFSKLMSTVRRLTNPKSFEMAFTFTESGMPIVTPKLDFDLAEGEKRTVIVVPHEDIFRLLNEALAETKLQVWVIFDRLDEAFQGYPETEKAALRALLRTYLDLLEFTNIKVKLFVRKDLFKKVIKGGFVNLTHVNARKIEIIWDDEDLLNILCKRIKKNEELSEHIGLVGKTDINLFYTIFPKNVDPGTRKPTTWTWITNRIKDGNGVKPPRNLIDIVQKAQTAQLRKEDRVGRTYSEGIPIIEPDSLRKGLSKLSEERVLDTLLAETPEYEEIINKFKNGKAEHNICSIGKLLGVLDANVKSTIAPLIEIGFLEEVGESYKIPMLYREGLSITQGKAFPVGLGPENIEEEEEGV
jgi:hypothetical protein